MSARTRVWIVLACLCLSACATADAVGKRNAAWYAANTADLDPVAVGDFARRDASVTAEIEQVARIVGRPDADRSRAFVDGGIEYAHDRCSKYLEAVFFFNRIRNTSSREIRYASAGTSALLALVKASRQLAGIVPLGFDFADQTLNNVGQGLLYDLDPGIIQGLVTQRQNDFVKTLDGVQFTTHAQAMSAIRSYAELCLPVSIEGEVNARIAASAAKTPPAPPAAAAAKP